MKFKTLSSPRKGLLTGLLNRRFSGLVPAAALVAAALTTPGVLEAQTGYQYPPNWELTEHTNGETFYFYEPAEFDPEGSYPLVLALHGCCWDGVRPASPPPDPIAAGFHGFAQNEQIEPTFILFPYSRSGWIQKADNIFEIIDEIKAAYPIASERILLTGFSMGASGAIDFVRQYPDYFAGAVMTGGRFGNADSIDLSGVRENMPMWFVIGTEDSYVSNQEITAHWRDHNGYPRDDNTAWRGVYPRLDVHQGVAHGPAMEAAFGTAELIPWLLSLKNDGNISPWVRFTSPEYNTWLEEGETAVTLIVEAGDSDGEVVRIELYRDDEMIASADGDSLEHTVTGLTGGDHTFRVVARDNGGEGTAPKEIHDRIVIHLPRELSIATSELAPAYIGEFYRQQLSAHGVNGRVRWSLPSLRDVPPAGLMLWADGRLEGYPMETGVHEFTVRAQDLKGEFLTTTVTFEVLPPRSQTPIMSSVEFGVSRRVLYEIGLWATSEPFGLSGYGDPPGDYGYAAHPNFDSLGDDAGLPGSYLLRVDSNMMQNTEEDWISFYVDGPATVYVGYMVTETNAVPAWLEERGFTETEDLIRAYLRSFRLFKRDYQDEVVVLGGNEGAIHGASLHYIVTVQSNIDGANPFNPPGNLQVEDGRIINPVASWMGDYYIGISTWPWIYHKHLGWTYLFSEEDNETFWSYNEGDYLWLDTSTFPWIYSLEHGWVFLIDSNDVPWFYRERDGEWVVVNPS